MESKDLKNSEELMRPVSDDSELTNEAGGSASSSVDNENEIVDETSPANEADEVTEESAEVITETIEEPGDVTVEAEDPATAGETAELQETDALQEPEVVETLIESSETAAVVEPEASEVTTEAEPEIVEAPVVAEESVDAAENLSSAEIQEEPAVEPESAPEEVNAAPALSGDEKKEIWEEPVAAETENTGTSEDETGETNEEDEDVEDEGHPDYSQFSQIELVNTLRELVENEDGQDRKINLIVAAFNLKVKENIAELKKRFVEEGGNPDEFVAEEDPYENDIRELIKKHRQARFEQAKKMEAEKETNLQKKYAIIEDIKNLLNTEESINKTFQEFRELQRLWYELGPVPQAKMKDLWDTYHFHVENFYDYIKINKELRDLDLKKNLEMKINLCEKAEELLIEPSVIRAFNTLQKFHEQWREIGPVPRDKKDEIWDRFKAVTSAINQKHQEFFEKRKGEQKRNLEAKIALCEKVEEICNMEIDSHRDWDDKSKQLIELQKVWRTIGFAPKRDNNKIYDRFRNACDQFFNKKRDFYSQNKELQNKNMQMKIDLCMEAEALKESADWKKTTQQFIDIQKRWKEIGPVPRKHSDLLWKRFRAACDYFFDRKSEHFSDIDDEQLENLNAKKALITEVENFVPGGDVSDALKILREFQRKWTEIGHVPIREKDDIQNRFRTAINKHFDTLKVDSSKRESINFRSKIANLTENQRGLSKVRQEREKYMIKLKQLENDLTLLDNNIGFFANSKNAQALIADVNQKIADTREKIEMLKEKIRIIDDLDKTEY
ncbi:MAG: DUF349 domain-containing protein [Bacteroidota bacterium]